jgi:hypothetical protein
MSSNNFIPRNDAEFDSWFRNLLAYTVEKTDRTRKGDRQQISHRHLPL